MGVPKHQTSVLPLIDLDKGTPARVPLELLQGSPSVAALSKAGFQTVEQLADAVAAQFRLPRLELDTIDLSLELVNVVSKELA